MHRNARFIILAMTVGVICGRVSASVTQYTDFAAWQAATPSYTTLDFTGFPADTVMSTQYASLGVTFPDHDELVQIQDWLVYPQDGSGLSNSFGNHIITLQFDSPQYAIAAHHPGAILFRLFDHGTMIYSSPATGTSGFGHFGGYVSTAPFTSAQILDVGGTGPHVDNIYFGHPVPGPAAALPLFALGLLTPRRRRTDASRA